MAKRTFTVGGLLPSAARKALTGYFLERLQESKLDYGGLRSTYTEFIAMDEVTDEWSRYNIARECFQEALKQFESLHPLKWTGTRYVREGLEIQT